MALDDDDVPGLLWNPPCVFCLCTNIVCFDAQLVFYLNFTPSAWCPYAVATQIVHLRLGNHEPTYELSIDLDARAEHTGWLLEVVRSISASMVLPNFPNP
jgi:hypothetical protein